MAIIIKLLPIVGIRYTAMYLCPHQKARNHLIKTLVAGFSFGAVSLVICPAHPAIVGT